MQSYQQVRLDHQKRQNERTSSFWHQDDPTRKELIEKMADHIKTSNPSPFIKSLYTAYTEWGALTSKQEVAARKFFK